MIRLSMLILAGCTTMAPSSSWLPPTAPVPDDVADPPAAPDDAPVDDASERSEAPASTAPTPPEPTGPDTPPAADAAGAMSDADLMASMLAVPKEPEPPPASAAPAPAPPEVVASAPPALESPAASMDWGVRLVSTLPNTQPPRAILALGSGREVVVEPGTMLPEARLVVLAIGPEAVQVALVEPLGDRARVTTQTLQPLYARARHDAP